VISIYEVEYIVLIHAIKLWIWLLNALEELNISVTNAAMLCNHKATINITYNYIIRNQAIYIDMAYHLEWKNVEFG
jgi:hypothetical protein